MNIKNWTIQNYGTSLALYIKGDNEQDAYENWLDLLNFSAIGSRSEDDKPNFVADAMIDCWTTAAKLKKYLFMRNAFRLADVAKKGDKTIHARAKQLAEQQYNSILTESFRSIGSNTEEYQMGTISAESPDNSFEDECWKAALTPPESLKV